MAKLTRQDVLLNTIHGHRDNIQRHKPSPWLPESDEVAQWLEMVGLCAVAESAVPCDTSKAERVIFRLEQSMEAAGLIVNL